jgi:hypothetical protein
MKIENNRYTACSTSFANRPSNVTSFRRHNLKIGDTSSNLTLATNRQESPNLLEVLNFMPSAGFKSNVFQLDYSMPRNVRVLVERVESLNLLGCKSYS